MNIFFEYHIMNIRDMDVDIYQHDIILPNELIVEIATCHHRAFRLIKHSCRLFYQTLSKINKLDLFTDKCVINEPGIVLISHKLKSSIKQVIRFEFLMNVQVLHVYIKGNFYMGKEYFKDNCVIRTTLNINDEYTTKMYKSITDNDFNADLMRLRG